MSSLNPEVLAVCHMSKMFGLAQLYVVRVGDDALMCFIPSKKEKKKEMQRFNAVIEGNGDNFLDELC